jgi:preprotein translocase subunit SecF
MPDEFPTLEVIAALATLAVLVRAAQLVGALSELRSLSDKIAGALRIGDRETARKLCAESEGIEFARVARTILDALGSGPVDRDGVARAVKHASSRVEKRFRRASASGALAGLLLVGMLFYTVFSRVSPGARAVPSTLFDVLVLLGVIVLTVGIFLNQRLSAETRRAAQSMLEAATTAPRGSA